LAGRSTGEKRQEGGKRERAKSRSKCKKRGYKSGGGDAKVVSVQKTTQKGSGFFFQRNKGAPGIRAKENGGLTWTSGATAVSEKHGDSSRKREKTAEQHKKQNAGGGLGENKGRTAETRGWVRAKIDERPD